MNAAEPGWGDAGITPPDPSAAAVRIIYYTDPLCSWSWAFEPQWRRLRYEFDSQITWSYRMGGMIESWLQYSDPLNDISRPVQLGPQWFQVRELSGMPLEERIWFEDPPSSSYPACVAVKAAAQQGAPQGEQYLRRVREAAMVERRNVARRECLVALAQELAGAAPGTRGRTGSPFDATRFADDLAGQEVLADFRRDLQDIRYRGIGRFPTLALLDHTNRGIMIVGYRPYAALRETLERFAPALASVRQAQDALEVVRYWGRITAREVAEALNQDVQQTERALAAGVSQGDLVQHGVFYAPARHGLEAVSVQETTD